MNSDETKKVFVEYTPEFKRNLRILSKKYRNIRNDIEPVLIQLAKGETPGVQIKGLSHTVYKTRIRNSDLTKGKKQWLSLNLLHSYKRQNNINYHLF